MRKNNELCVLFEQIDNLQQNRRSMLNSSFPRKLPQVSLQQVHRNLIHKLEKGREHKYIIPPISLTFTYT
jgi:hypothetical protein